VHWPQLEERARGVADYWGLAYDDRAEAVALPVGFPRGGCSVVWLPPQRTASGAAALSRALDFRALTLNEMLGAPPGEDDEPFCGRPNALETRPASGYEVLGLHRLAQGRHCGRVRPLLAAEPRRELRSAACWQGGCLISRR
jgi:hypothetical protein